MRSQWRDYVVVGFFMAAAPFALFAFAERSITAGLGSIINATTPLWTAIILAVWLRQAPTPRRVAAIVVGFAGVGVIVGLEGIQLAPDAARRRRRGHRSAPRRTASPSPTSAAGWRPSRRSSWPWGS